MRHALVYHGSYELNYDKLAPGSATYTATDGRDRSLAATPPAIDGVVFGYMERAAKKFTAVRLTFEDHDIVLRNPLVLDPMRHMGNRRFSPKPVEIQDDVASALLDDIIAANPEQQTELALLLNRVNHVRRGDRESIE
jgi:hypothetical protein